jgi:hypothetical protein
MKNQIREYLKRTPSAWSVLSYVVIIWALHLTGFIGFYWIFIVVGFLVSVVFVRQPWLAGFAGWAIGFGSLHLWFTALNWLDGPRTTETFFEIQAACFLGLIFPALGFLLTGILLGLLSRKWIGPQKR